MTTEQAAQIADALESATQIIDILGSIKIELLIIGFVLCLHVFIGAQRR